MLRYNLRKRENSNDDHPPKKQKTRDGESSGLESTDEDFETSDDESDPNYSPNRDDFIQDDDPIDAFIYNVHRDLKSHGIPVDELEHVLKSNMVELVMTVDNFQPKNVYDDFTPKQMEEYERLVKELKDEEPSVIKVMQSFMTPLEKKLALQKLDMMSSCTPGSETYYAIRSNLIASIKQANIKNLETETDLVDQETKIKEFMRSKTSLREKILRLEAPLDVKTLLYSKYEHLLHMDATDSAYSRLANQIEIMTELPYRKTCKIDDENPRELLNKIKIKLDKDIYGLENVKRLFLALINNSLTSFKNSKAIALCGEPGSGKTSIVKTFADAIGLPFAHISLGGAKDSTMFYGSDDVYLGAGPGIIVRILRRMKCCNGIILFDEIDKLGDTPEGKEMQHALLHITDFVQNNEFKDKYLPDITLDLSQMWFFYSMNDASILDKALQDRLPVVHIKPYSVQEKRVIVQNYIFPNLKRNLDIQESIILDDTWLTFITNLEDMGIRKIKEIVYTFLSLVKLHITCQDYTKFGLKFPLIVTLDVWNRIVDQNPRKELSYFS